MSLDGRAALLMKVPVVQYPERPVLRIMEFSLPPSQGHSTNIEMCVGAYLWRVETGEGTAM